MSNFVRHERCPKCAAEGKDRHGDNLAVFDDGSKFCFSCGFNTSSKGIERLKASTQDGDSVSPRTVCLPRDSSFELHGRARDYLTKYALTQEDINVNRIMWSEEWQRIIFPYFDGGGLLGWQGRYLGDQSDKGKWFSQGDLKNIQHICAPPRTDTDQRSIVLVEDVISAIRVGHIIPCSPIFGSHISLTQAIRYDKFYKELVIWLDKDKQHDSIKFAQRFNTAGIKTRNIITDKDPKEYSDKEILDILQ